MRTAEEPRRAGGSPPHAGTDTDGRTAPAEVVQHQKQSRPRRQPGGRCRHLVSTQCGSGCSGDSFSLSFLRSLQRKAMSTCIVRTWGAGGSPGFCFAEQPRGWYCSGPNWWVTEVMLPVLMPRGRTASPLLRVPTTLLPFLPLASAASISFAEDPRAAGCTPHVASRDGKKRIQTLVMHTHTHIQFCAYFTLVNVNKAGESLAHPKLNVHPKEWRKQGIPIEKVG